MTDKTLGKMVQRVSRHFGTRTVRHQDTSAPNNWCRSVLSGHFGTNFMLVPNCLTVILDWCRTVWRQKYKAWWHRRHSP